MSYSECDAASQHGNMRDFERPFYTPAKFFELAPFSYSAGQGSLCNTNDRKSRLLRPEIESHSENIQESKNLSTVKSGYQTLKPRHVHKVERKTVSGCSPQIRHPVEMMLLLFDPILFKFPIGGHCVSVNLFPIFMHVLPSNLPKEEASSLKINSLKYFSL